MDKDVPPFSKERANAYPPSVNEARARVAVIGKGMPPRRCFSFPAGKLEFPHWETLWAIFSHGRACICTEPHLPFPNAPSREEDDL